MENIWYMFAFNINNRLRSVNLNCVDFKLHPIQIYQQTIEIILIMTYMIICIEFWVSIIDKFILAGSSDSYETARTVRFFRFCA